MDIQAVIFDCNGVIERHGEVDHKLLDYIEALSDVQKAVFTRMNSSTLKVLLRTAGKNPFDELFTIDTFDFVKPDPDAFTAVAVSLGLSTSQCIMIDDSRANIAGAEKSGMHGIFYRSLDQLMLELAEVMKV